MENIAFFFVISQNNCKFSIILFTVAFFYVMIDKEIKNQEDKMASANKRNALFRVAALLEAMIILLMLIVFVFFIFIRGNKDAVKASKQDPEVRTRAFIEKEETFYQLDGKKILMHDTTLGEVFVPVYSDVPASDINTDNIVTRNGYSFYMDGETVKSQTGIDISEHQGEIDWGQVKGAGIDFAMIRAGYRTYGGGIVTIDENFTDNLQKANAAGIDTGVYFFSQATSTEEAIEEADAVLDAISGCNITYPVVYDWEMIFDDNARTDDVSVETLADCCIAFCERVKSAGYTPMIYQNKSTAMHKLDLPRLKDYDFWLAEYGDKPTYYYKYDIWQYSSSGTIPGIEGRVDLNLSFRNYGKKEISAQTDSMT